MTKNLDFRANVVWVHLNLKSKRSDHLHFPQFHKENYNIFLHEHADWPLFLFDLGTLTKSEQGNVNY